MTHPLSEGTLSTGPICVVGLGYIGLPTAVVLAQAGFDVIGFDVSSASVDTINQGRLPFVEHGLETALSEVVSQGKLHATTTIASAAAFIVAVPTPFGNNHEADLSYIEAAAKEIASVLKGGELVILESTSPPGTTQFMADAICKANPNVTSHPGHSSSVYFAHCPERVLPGRIMVEMLENDRIIGGLTAEGATLAKELYGSFCTGELLLTNAKTAEMAKLTENAFRDVNIAFANELSLISDRMGIDVWELIELANHHPRVNILQPGPGVGGHCIAVDPWFIVSADRENARLIETARNVNDSKPDFVIRKVIEAAQGNETPKIAALGISFKANIDDLRNSPAREIVQRIALKLPQAHLLVAEPNIEALPSELEELPNVSLHDVEEAVSAADIVLLLVEHREFVNLAQETLNGRTVIDTRGIWRR